MEYTIKSSPIYTNFLLDSANKIDLFSSRQFYKRKGLTEIEDVIETQNLQHTLTVTAIVLSSVALVASFALVLVYCRLRKSASKMEESLMEN